MRLWRRHGPTEAERALAHEEVQLEAIRRKRARVMRLVRELRLELEHNSFAERLEQLWRSHG